MGKSLRNCSQSSQMLDMRQDPELTKHRTNAYRPSPLTQTYTLFLNLTNFPYFHGMMGIGASLNFVPGAAWSDRNPERRQCP